MKTTYSKRILSAVLAFILLISCVPVFSIARSNFAITYESQTISTLELPMHEKLQVSAENLPDGCSYQWQIQIPGSDMWVDIQGKTAQTLDVSYAVVGSLTDSSNCAYIRCSAVSGGEMQDSTRRLCVMVMEEEVPETTAPIEESPAATEAVVATEPDVVPETTEAPVVTEPVVIPEATEAPVVTEPVVIPEATETPVVTEPVVVPEATEAPVVTEPVVVPEATEAPVVTEPVVIPEATEAPVVTAPVVVPEATEAPVVTEPVVIPEATETPVVTEPVVIPEATEAPVVTEPVVIPEATEAPVVTEPVVAPEATEPAPVVEGTVEFAAPAPMLSAPAVDDGIETVADETTAEETSTDTTENTEEVTASQETTPTEFVTVTIHYRAVNRDNKFETTGEDATIQDNAVTAADVTDPRSSRIFKGTDLEITIPCQVIPGYALVIPSYYTGDELTVVGNNLMVSLENVTEDKDFYVYYMEKEVSYTARYFIQNVYNDLYTEDTTILTPAIKEKMKGFPGDEPNQDVIYPEKYGFTALFFQPDTIAADGSTVFEVYYDRNYYLINFNMDGGFGTAPVYARYDTAFTVSPPTRSGYSFSGWTETARNINTDGSAERNEAYITALEQCIAGIPKNHNGRVTKIPFSNLTYKANWTQNPTTYKVAYWIDNVTGPDTYIGSKLSTADSGVQVSGANDLTADTLICGNSEHTHTEACFVCDHVHTEACVSGWNGKGNAPDEQEMVALRALGEEPQNGYVYAISYNGNRYIRVKLSDSWYGWLNNGTEQLLGYELRSATVDGYTATKYRMITNLPSCTANHNHADDVLSCNAHSHSERCKVRDFDYLEFVRADENLTVEGDGSTVVNVYYRYKEYTLKFYYAKTTGGTDSNEDNIPDTGFTTVEIPGGTTYDFGYRGTEFGHSKYTADDATLLAKVGSWGTITGTELPSLKNNTDTYEKGALKVGDYYYHYLSFKARFGDNISAKWPCDVLNTAERADTTPNGYQNEWTSTTAVVSAWNPETYVKYVSNNNNPTVKGKYELLDENLLFDPAYGEAKEISFLCFWENGKTNVDWNIPGLFRYNIYLEALPDTPENDTDIIKQWKNDKGETETVRYYLKETYDTCDNSTPGEQTQPSLVGYTPRYYNSSIKTYKGTEIIDNLLYGGDFEYRVLEDYDSSVYNKGFELNFYYEVNIHTLNFWNLNDYMVNGDGEEFAYGASLKKFKVADTEDFMMGNYEYNGQKYPSYYPDALEPNAYRFEGWYTSSDCYADTKVNWETLTMPDADLTVYASWQPVSYDTYFYMDLERYEARTHFHKTTGTAHGQSIDASQLNAIRDLKFKDENDVQIDKYRFVNWFYIDTDGTKKAFNPSEMAVRKELHLFAEWTTSIVQEYEVSYVYGVWDADQNKYVPATEPAHELARVSTGYALEATTKTFTALPKDKLTSFPTIDGEGTSGKLWLPHTNSHSIVMRAPETKEVDGKPVTVNPNVYTFYYITAEKAPYTVRYLDAATQEPIWKDEDGNEIKGGDANNQLAVVTVTFKYFEDYIPDAFHKRLVLSANPADNEIIFYYTKDDDADDDPTGGGTEPDTQPSLYLVVHHYPDIPADPSSGTVTYTDFEETGRDYVGTKVAAVESDRIGFVFDADTTKAKYDERFGGNSADSNVTQNTDGKWTVSGVVTTGADEANKALELHLYYTRGLYSYRVEHKDWESQAIIKVNDTPLIDYYSGAAFESIVTQQSRSIVGYDVYAPDVIGGNTKTLSLEISHIEDANVITFYYVRKKVTIEYIPICTNANLTSGFGGVSNPLDYDRATPRGSQAAAASGFCFLGWYTSQTPDPQHLVTDNAILDATKIQRLPDVYDYTYYAIFKPITLTIKQEGMRDDNESGIYEVVNSANEVICTVAICGNSSVTLEQIPAGAYTIREITSDWTWTYDTTNQKEFEVKANENNIVTFTHTPKTVDWLHSECHNQTN